ncbi:MAG: XdhC family protein [Thermoplasmata archaeon]
MLNNWDFPKIAQDLIDAGQPFCVVTIVNVSGSSIGKPGFRMIVSGDGKIIAGTLGGACPDSVIIEKSLDILRKNEPGMVKIFLEDTREALKGIALNRSDEIHVETFCGGIMEVFIEPFRPGHRVILISSGGRDEVEISLVNLCNMAGFQAVVVDSNPDFSDARSINVASDKIEDGSFKISSDDFIVVLTKGAEDLRVLKMLSRFSPRYVGMLASRKRFENDVKMLTSEGVSKDFLDSIHSPVGIDIGAVTPFEISLSIMAEIIENLRKPKNLKKEAGGT